jgi:hypothetical protein
MTGSLSPRQLELANRHGLVGVIADTHREVDGSVLGTFTRLEARQRIMEGYLRLILEHLAAQKIPAAVLKGPFLSRTYYRTPAQRTYTDLDLLVQRADLDRSLEALVDLPFVASSIPEKRPTGDKRDIPVYDLQKNLRFNIDLHWDLYSYAQLRGAAFGATEEAWEHASESPDHELGPMWVLPQEAELAFLCTHAWLDHRFRLILFRDLVEFTATQQIDWDRFVDYTTRWNLRSISYVALLIAARLLDASVPHEVLSRLRIPSLPLRFIEQRLPRIDLVDFDGHTMHPLNLAAVVLHDDPAVGRRLVLTAPIAFPGWRRRVTAERQTERAQRDIAQPGSLLLIVPASKVAAGAQDELGRGLSDLGWAVDLVAVPDKEAAPEGTANLINDARTMWRVRREIARHKPAVILACGLAALVFANAALLGRRRRPPLVFEPGIDADGVAYEGRDEAALERQVRRLDAVLAPSSEVSERFTRRYGIAADKVFVAGAPQRAGTESRPAATHDSAAPTIEDTTSSSADAPGHTPQVDHRIRLHDVVLKRVVRVSNAHELAAQ